MENAFESFRCTAPGPRLRSGRQLQPTQLPPPYAKRPRIQQQPPQHPDPQDPPLDTSASPHTTHTAQQNTNTGATLFPSPTSHPCNPASLPPVGAPNGHTAQPSSTAHAPAAPGSTGPSPSPALSSLPSPNPRGGLTRGSSGAAKGVPPKLGDMPLRLIVVGHNPSEHAWRSGHYYSNPSNRMWPILIKTGIAPPGSRDATADDGMPSRVGVGFLDVGCGHPGTDSSSFKSEVFDAWSRAFYQRLRDHMATASASIGCTCGRCGAPSLVAFSGKRQFLELLNVGRSARDRIKTVEIGPQRLLPAGWPFPAGRTEVWVCSSTSGAAAMTTEQREGPYQQLAERLRGIQWPRAVELACGGQGGAGS